MLTRTGGMAASAPPLLRATATEKLLVQGVHFPFPATGYVEKVGTGYRLVPVSWNPTL